MTSRFLGLRKCLNCGYVAVKSHSSERFVDSAVFVELDIPIPFAGFADNRVIAKVIVQIHSLDPLSQDDQTLTAIALQLALDRVSSQSFLP